MGKHRPVNRLLRKQERGRGKAQVVETPKQLNHIMWVASRGDLGVRNVAILWMLFGSGMRINEVPQLLVSDVVYPSGALKKAFVIRGAYTKTNNPRAAYILADAHRQALTRWLRQRQEESIRTSENASYGGLNPKSPLFLVKIGKSWRNYSFGPKKYIDKDGVERSAMVCRSIENMVRALLKSAGLHYGSSHSGRRTLANWLDRKGHDLELIQRILGHESPDMTLGYIAPYLPRIENAFKNTWENVI